MHTSSCLSQAFAPHSASILFAKATGRGTWGAASSTVLGPETAPKHSSQCTESLLPINPQNYCPAALSKHREVLRQQPAVENKDRKQQTRAWHCQRPCSSCCSRPQTQTQPMPGTKAQAPTQPAALGMQLCLFWLCGHCRNRNTSCNTADSNSSLHCSHSFPIWKIPLLPQAHLQSLPFLFRKGPESFR